MMLALLPVITHSQNLITVPRYDDADEYLPEAERKNVDGVRLFLKQQPGEETWTAISERRVSVKVIAHIPEAAKAGVIIFPGGTGQLSMTADGRLDRSFNFSGRSRSYYWPLGLATFLVDAPSDHLDKTGITAKFRASPEFANDIRAVINMISQKFDKPLHAVGHSNGAIAVATIAAMHNLPISSYTLMGPNYGSTDTVANTNYTKPVFIVENTEDTCKLSSAAGIDALSKSINAPSMKVSWVDGGKNILGGPCGPFSRHSFVGVEDLAVQAVAASLP
jgi:pimeloyl-ACP methyl ester carboxylesterase